jgi:predicted amidophosphoribosyltransferase
MLVVGSTVFVIKLAVDQMRMKGRLLGISLRPLVCPKCDQRVPYLRAPNSTRQALWGGWTCSACGTEMDRHGHDVSSSVDVVSAHATVSPYNDKGETPIERVFRDEDT